jgi:hypothetical protein
MFQQLQYILASQLEVLKADPGGRAAERVGHRPLASRDCGFEYRRGRDYLL